METLEDLYYCVGWVIPLPFGEKTEWRIHRYMYDESIYILYKKAARLEDPNDCAWLWQEWYAASKEECQAWFKLKRPIKMKINSITQQYYQKDPIPVCVPDCGTAGLACTPSPAPEGRWYHGDFFPVSNQEGNNPMNTLNATATVNTKTDLQTQREYLLGRHKEVTQSFDWGTLSGKFGEAFNLRADNTPKTATELFDGIKSGKYTLKADEAARQEIEAARDGRVYFYDMFDAVNWGGLTPDRTGYEKARDAFFDSLKLLKDQIMTGDPAESAKQLQVLEAWTPPAAAN